MLPLSCLGLSYMLAAAIDGSPWASSRWSRSAVKVSNMMAYRAIALRHVALSVTSVQVFQT